MPKRPIINLGEVIAKSKAKIQAKGKGENKNIISELGEGKKVTKFDSVAFSSDEKEVKEMDKEKKTDKPILEVKIGRDSNVNAVLGYIAHNLQENGQVLLKSLGGANPNNLLVADALKKHEEFREVDRKEGKIKVERNRRSYLISRLTITLERSENVTK